MQEARRRSLEAYGAEVFPDAKASALKTFRGRLRYLGAFVRLVAESEGTAAVLEAGWLLAAFVWRRCGLPTKKRVFSVKTHGLVFDIDVAGYDQSAVFEIVIDGRYGRFDCNLSESPIIVDCGANIGAFSLDVLNGHRGGRVFSFEPSVSTFRRFQRNLALNPHLAEGITAMNWAVSDIVGTCRFVDCDSSLNSFVLSDPGESESAKSTEVQACTLDHFINERSIEHIDLLKIDTEGHEVQVLRGGGKKALAITRNVILEVHRRGDLATIEGILTEAGFVWAGADGAVFFFNRVGVSGSMGASSGRPICA